VGSNPTAANELGKMVAPAKTNNHLGKELSRLLALLDDDRQVDAATNDILIKLHKSFLVGPVVKD
jgi:hypothetical protein